MDPTLPTYRLARSEEDLCWPYLSESGVFHGAGTPLLRKRKTVSGVAWEPRPQAEIEYLFSVGYDQLEVEASGWWRGLEVVAKALNDGDVSLAAIALVLCKIPPLPSPHRAEAMSLADELAKYNAAEARIPRGQSTSGRWTYGTESSSGNTGQVAPRTSDDGSLEDIAYSPEALLTWRPLRDAIEQDGTDLEQAENIVSEILGNVSISELPDDVRTFLQPPKPLRQLFSPKPVRAFATWRELEAYVGKAPPGYEWHHIVEQSVARERRGYDPLIDFEIQNTENIVLIPKLRHLMISADMSTKGVRGMIHLHSLQDQYDFGLFLLKKWGAAE